MAECTVLYSVEGESMNHSWNEVSKKVKGCTCYTCFAINWSELKHASVKVDEYKNKQRDSVLCM